MLSNRTILREVADYLKQCSAARQEEIVDLMADYERACDLSRGRDVARSAHWDSRAHDLCLNLCESIGYCGPKPVNRLPCEVRP